jgi:hypothetical protein
MELWVTYNGNANVAPQNVAKVLESIVDAGLKLGVVGCSVGRGNWDIDVAGQHTAQKATGDGLEGTVSNRDGVDEATAEDVAVLANNVAKNGSEVELVSNGVCGGLFVLVDLLISCLL